MRPVRLGRETAAVPRDRPRELVLAAAAHHPHVRALLVLVVEEDHREQGADDKEGVEERVEEGELEVSTESVGDDFSAAPEGG